MKTLTLVDYLTLAFAKKLYFLRSWRICNLMRLVDYPNRTDLYPFKEGNDYFVNYEGEVFKLGIKTETSPLKWDTELKLPKGFIANISEPITTTFGILLINNFAYAEEFGDLIPYQNNEISTGNFHKAYYSLYKAGKITNTNQLLNSAKYIHILEADADFGVPAASIETFTTHPDMVKVVKEQLELNKDDLDSPATHAKIDAVTTQLDRDYVKGTQAEKFLISGKMHDVVRKKTKIMYGSETGLDGKPTPLISRSLEDGVDLERMPDWVDAARNGAYGRGGMTALGGYEVKSDERAYGHLEVEIGKDCKTKRGLTVQVRDYNYAMYEGMRLLSTNEPLALDALSKMVGKEIVLRAPSHCALKRDYCQFCMGEMVGAMQYGIPSGVSVIDSKSMDAQMQASHGKAAKAIKLNIFELMN